MNGILHRSAEAVAQGKLQPTWAKDEEGPLNTSPPRRNDPAFALRNRAESRHPRGTLPAIFIDTRAQIEVEALRKVRERTRSFYLRASIATFTTRSHENKKRRNRPGDHVIAQSHF